jgi:predicted amidohydrolase
LTVGFAAVVCSVAASLIYKETWNRLDVGQLANVVLLELGEERARHPVIGIARVAG